MKTFRLVFAFLLLTSTLIAQTGKVYPKTGIKKGVLKNGFTYYIYNNPASRGKVNFYLLQNVGAILEEDSQYGLAHFLEHMCFNGTKNFPGQTIVDKFSAKGLRYSINAFTGVDETVYHFLNVPSADRAFCDECLFMMYDWCSNITLASDRIEAERPVIVEEIRTRNDLNNRVREKTAVANFNNTKYAYRNIAGSPDVIKTFNRQELIEFYNTWYRPDLQSIIVIGDVDIYETEQKIINLYSTLPQKENPKERYKISIPDNSDTYFEEVRDVELSSASVRINFRHPMSLDANDNFRGLLLNTMLKKRVQTLLINDANKEINKEPTFTTLNMSFSGINANYGNYSINIGYVKGKGEKALSTAFGMHKYLLENGFTQQEFEDAKNNYRMGLESMKRANGALPSKYIFESIKKNYINNKDIVDAASTLKDFDKLAKTLTLDDITQELNRWYSGPNKSVFVLGGLEDTLFTMQEILDIEANCKALKVLPADAGSKEDDKSGGDVSANTLLGSAVVTKEKMEAFTAEKWVLENGATVIYKECNVNPDIIDVYAESPGGLSTLEGNDLANGYLFQKFIPAFGIKGLNAQQYKQLLQTKGISCYPQLTQTKDVYLLRCRYTELDQAFQIMYNQFENPEFYKDNFDEIYLAIGNQLDGAKITHKKLLSDTIGFMRYGKAHQAVNSSWFEGISYEAMSKVYKNRFRDVGDFTFYIVGGIGKAKAKKLAEKYIGSIKQTKRVEEAVMLENVAEQGRMKKTFTYEIPGEQAGVIYNMDMHADYSIKNRICVTMLKDYLQEKLNHEIREKQRGTYGVEIAAKVERYSTKNYNFNITFECDPERATELDDILHNTLTAICTSGMSQTDFEVLKKKLDKPQGKPAIDNMYYINVLKEYMLSGTNTAVEGYVKHALDEIDLDYINAFLKNQVATAAILDIIYLPEM